MKPMNFRSLSRPVRVLYDVSVARNSYKTVSMLNQNWYIIYIYMRFGTRF